MSKIQNKIKCRFCNGERTWKLGFVDKDKKRRRYYCLDCRKYSREESEKLINVLPDKEFLIKELQQIARALNRTPMTADIDRLSSEKKCHSRKIYYKVFGTLVNAIKVAGLKQHYEKDLDREKLLSEMRRFGSTFNRPISAPDVAEAGKKKLIVTPNHFKKVFGTVTNAINESGTNNKYSIDHNIDFSKFKGCHLPKARKYSREELINYLKKLERKLGRIPRYRDVEENYKKYVNPPLTAYLNEFGSFPNARKAAHISNKKWQKYSKAELLEQMKKLGEKLGRKPSGSDIHRSCKNGDMASLQVFINNFGSIVKACEAAGFETLKPKKYSDIEIIKRLRKLRQKLGRKINQNDIRKASREGWCPCLNTVCKKIGGVEKIEEILTNG